MSEQDTSLKYYSEEDFSRFFLEIHDSADGKVINYRTVMDRLNLHSLGSLDAEEEDHIRSAARSKLLEIINNAKMRINRFAKNGKGLDLINEAVGKGKFRPFQLKISTRCSSWQKVANPTLARSAMLDCKQQVAGSLNRTGSDLTFVVDRIPATENQHASITLVNRLLSRRRQSLELEDQDLLEFIDRVLAGEQPQLPPPAA